MINGFDMAVNGLVVRTPYGSVINSGHPDEPCNTHLSQRSSVCSHPRKLQAKLEEGGVITDGNIHRPALFCSERYLRFAKVKGRVFERTTAIDRHKVRMTNQQCVCVCVWETDAQEQLCVTRTLAQTCRQVHNISRRKLPRQLNMSVLARRRVSD